jgi:hypothetical protein
MAAKDRIGKAGEGAFAAQGSRYIQRLIEDEDLRSSLLSAYAAGRSAFGRMSNGTPAAQALFEDRKLQQELTDAANALRQAAGSLREPPEPVKPAKRRGGLGRPLLLLAVGSVLAIALSEGLRAKVLDLLFGAEEEFDYSPTTAPETPAPAGVAGG